MSGHDAPAPAVEGEPRVKARTLRTRAGRSPSHPRSRRRPASQLTLQPPIIRHTAAVEYSISRPRSKIRPIAVDRFHAKKVDGLFPCHQAPPRGLLRLLLTRQRIARAARHSPALARAGFPDETGEMNGRNLASWYDLLALGKLGLGAQRAFLGVPVLWPHKNPVAWWDCVHR